MGRDRSALRNRAEALAVAALRGVFARMAPESAEAVGRRLGLVYRRVDRRRRELARANIARAFPERSPEDVDALSRAVFAHFGGLATEILHASGRPVSEVVARVEFPRAADAREALRSGRGVFFLTAHLGNWECSALGMAASGVTVSVVARPLDNPLLDARLTGLRTSNGNAIIEKHDAARGMLRALRGRRRPRGPRGPARAGRPTRPRALLRAARLDDVGARPDRRPHGGARASGRGVRIAPRRYRLVLESGPRRSDPAGRGAEAAPLTARFNAILEGMIQRRPSSGSGFTIDGGSTRRRKTKKRPGTGPGR